MESHPDASTLPYAAAAQRARLAALNALAVAPPGPGGDEVAALFPRPEERRLDPAGQPTGVRTATVLGREAAPAASAVGLAEEVAAAREAGDGGDSGGGGRAGVMDVVGGDGVWGGGGEEVAVGVEAVVEALCAAGKYEEACDAVFGGLNDQVRYCGWGGVG